MTDNLAIFGARFKTVKPSERDDNFQIIFRVSKKYWNEVNSIVGCPDADIENWFLISRTSKEAAERANEYLEEALHREAGGTGE